MFNYKLILFLLAFFLGTVTSCDVQAQTLPERFQRDTDRLGLVSRLQEAAKDRNSMANQLSAQRRLIENLAEQIKERRTPTPAEPSQAIFDRFEKTNKAHQEKLAEGIFRRLQQEQEINREDEAYNQEQIAQGIFNRWQKDCQESETADRSGLLQALKTNRDEGKKLGERMQNFKPVQGLVDRATSLVFKLIWLIVSLVLLATILGVAYLRLKARFSALSNIKQV